MSQEIKELIGRQTQAELYNKLATPLRSDILRHYPDYELQMVTDFGKEGLGRWRHHKQSSLTVFRQPPDISHFSYWHSKSMDLTTTQGVSSAEAWGRYSNGGRVFDGQTGNKVDKILVGGVYAMRAFAESSIAYYWFGIDRQVGQSNRVWFRGRINAGNVFEYSSTGVDTPTWVAPLDSTGATIFQDFNWNEPLKPMFTPIILEIDSTDSRLTSLVWNGQKYGLSAPVSAGTPLAEFGGGMINMHVAQNLPSGTIAQQTVLVESPFFAFKYSYES